MLFRPDKSSVCFHPIGVEMDEKFMNYTCSILISHIKHLLLTYISISIFSGSDL